MSNSSLGFLDRALVAGLTQSPQNKLAARGLRKAQHLMSLALAAQIAELRTSGDPLAAAAGKSEESAVLLNLWTEIAHILGARWEKLPDRRRPHYTPEQRYRILRLKVLLHLSRDEAAHIFRVSAETIGNWEREATTNPDHRLEYALHDYAFFRPHQGLGGATPAEIYLDLEPTHFSAVHPPRGRPGEGSHRSPFAIEYLDPEHRFPILRKVA